MSKELLKTGVQFIFEVCKLVGILYVLMLLMQLLIKGGI